MAVDDWLLETEDGPLLRVYDWTGHWVSMGYFGLESDARAILAEGAKLVRRATGGGIVDHGGDQTYTLVIPRSCELARLRGAESYRMIHTALVAALKAVGEDAILIEEDSLSESMACFEKPVAWDIVDSGGRKLAGAGQRRTRRGLLHQGSVVISGEAAAESVFDGMADILSDSVERVRREPSEEDLAAKRDSFASRSWTERR